MIYVYTYKRKEVVIIAPKANKHRDCLEANSRKMSRVLSMIYNKAMKDSKIKPSQFSLLNVINGKGKISIGELSKIMLMDQTTVTRNIKLLKKSGYVQINTGSDRRVKEVSLTAKGQEIRKKALPAWQNVQDQVWNQLGEEKVQQLFSLVDEVIELSDRL